MKYLKIIYIAIFLFSSIVFPTKAYSQEDDSEEEIFDTLLQHYYPTILVDGERFVYVELPDVFVFSRPFKNKREERQYTKLVRDIKRTLPYAKIVYATLIETYEYIETLPNDRERDKHLQKMEKDLFKEYKPVLSKLSLTQGKLLIKLIDRECNQNAFNLVKAYLGGFRAGFWNLFASMFGASLKSDYDPKGKDAEIERIVVLVEHGLI